MFPSFFVGRMLCFVIGEKLFAYRLLSLDSSPRFFFTGSLKERQPKLKLLRIHSTFG